MSRSHPLQATAIALATALLIATVPAPGAEAQAFGCTPRSQDNGDHVLVGGECEVSDPVEAGAEADCVVHQDRRDGAECSGPAPPASTPGQLCPDAADEPEARALCSLAAHALDRGWGEAYSGLVDVSDIVRFVFSTAALVGPTAFTVAGAGIGAVNHSGQAAQSAVFALASLAVGEAGSAGANATAGLLEGGSTAVGAVGSAGKQTQDAAFQAGSETVGAASGIAIGAQDTAFQTGSQAVGQGSQLAILAQRLGFQGATEAVGAAGDAGSEANGAAFGAASDAVGTAGSTGADAQGQAFGLAAHGLGLVEPDSDGNELGDVWEEEVCDEYDLGEGCETVSEVVNHDLADTYSCALSGDPTDPKSMATDVDCDGLSLFEEFCWATDPLDPDSDREDPDLGDHWEDGPEADHWLREDDDCEVNPGGGSVVRYESSTRDADGDGDPNIVDPDSDDDGLLDGDEAKGTHNDRYGHEATMPNASDTDGEGLDDHEELCDRDDEHDGWNCPDGEGWGSDPNDADTDGDNATDATEADHWGEADFRHDLDEDGVVNNLRDPDADGDSWKDTENGYDGPELHGNPETDPGDWDSEPNLGDGMPDGFERAHGLDPVANDAHLDHDQDALDNHFEYSFQRPGDHHEATDGPYEGGLDPGVADMDGDGLTDGEEVHGTHNGYPAGYYDGHPSSTNAEDPDTDGDSADANGVLMSDYHEAVVHKTDPNDGEGDADGDGLTDAYELSERTIHVNGDAVTVTSDPDDRDTDGDGLLDPDEDATGSHPQASDTDGDGLDDAEEEAEGCSPVAEDTDWDDIPDDVEIGYANDHVTNCANADTDDDGLRDGTELEDRELSSQSYSDPTTPDTDGDTLTDAKERDVGTDPRDVDSDDDGTPDDAELAVESDPVAGREDPDNDLVSTYAEKAVWHSAHEEWDTEGDGHPDGLDVEPNSDSSAPKVHQMTSGDYYHQLVIDATDASGTSLDRQESEVWFPDDDNPHDGTIDGHWRGFDDPQHCAPDLEKGRYGPKLDRYRIHVPDDCHIGQYDITLTDEHNNEVRLEGRVTSTNCVSEFSVKKFTEWAVGDFKDQQTEVMWEFLNDKFARLYGESKVFLSRAARKVFSLYGYLDFVTTDFEVTKCDTTTTDGQPDWADTDGVNMVFATDDRTVAIHTPGTVVEQVGPDGQVYRLGKGMARVNAASPDLTEGIVENTLENALDVAEDGSKRLYCNGNYEVLVWGSNVVTAREMTENQCTFEL